MADELTLPWTQSLDSTYNTTSGGLVKLPISQYYDECLTLIAAANSTDLNTFPKNVVIAGITSEIERLRQTHGDEHLAKIYSEACEARRNTRSKKIKTANARKAAQG